MVTAQRERPNGSARLQADAVRCEDGGTDAARVAELRRRDNDGQLYLSKRKGDMIICDGAA